ncbi:MAG TPA: TetR/AcrR family transcriptional regulator [Burkholderiales bacterium]|nr:TetR/AcrR family transcriptional regulator [Burkholderiales bacterium]
MARTVAASASSEKPKKRHAEIVAAAAKVFARRGYHGASTQDIADVLGIRQASLYYYFESKDAALEAVCAEGMEDYARRAQQILRGAESGADKVARLVFHHLAPLGERLDYTLVFLRERRFLPEPARKRIRALELKYERIIERIIQQAVDAGEFRADLDARMATLALLGLGNSAAAWYGREPGVTLERVTRDYVDLLVRAFRKGEAPVFRITH